MEHNRKYKLLMIIALVFSIASLSVGFAAFSTTLNISSSASVSPNSDTFSVKFSTNKDSLVVNSVTPSSNPYNLVTTNGTIDNSTNPTIKGLSTIFTHPGQYVEYKFYARNEGEYNAYLNNVLYLGEKICKAETGASEELVSKACDKIDIFITVGGVVTAPSFVSEHTLLKKTGEEIVVRLEYAENATIADGPFSIVFPVISFVYSTIDNGTNFPKIAKIESGTLNNPGSIVSIGNEKFYVIGQENGNVKLLSMYNLHVGSIVVDQYNATPLTNPTGIQDVTAKAWDYDVENQKVVSTFIGSTPFANSGSTYAGSIVEGYVNNYSMYLASLGANIAEARLITKDEVKSLGCTTEYTVCSEAPNWLYSTSYWFMTNYQNSVWAMDTRGIVSVVDASYPYDHGVRPVIEIPLSEF